MYSIIIEWGAQNPTGKWYRWLESVTGWRVRDTDRKPEDITAFDQAQSSTSELYREVEADLQDIPEEDRLKLLLSRSNDFGIIVQEGAIICQSYSLARLIYHLLNRGIKIERRATAKREAGTEIIKPKYVCMGEFTLMRDIEETEEDKIAMARAMATLTRRGRKPEQLQWAVTCLEELTTNEVETDSVIRCPKCGSVHYRVKIGNAPRLADPGTDLYDSWLRTRFSTGSFLIPLRGPDLPQDAAKVNVKDVREFSFLATAQMTPALRQAATLDREVGLRALDALYTVRTTWDAGRRTQARAKGLSLYIQAGGTLEGIDLSGEEWDLFDVIDFIGAPAVVKAVLSIKPA